MSKGQSSKVLVLLVTHNAAEWLEWSLAPFRVPLSGVDLLVVDSGSADGTPDLVEALFPHATLLRRRRHIGAVACYNIGLEYALVNDYKGVFLLSQKTRIEPSALLLLLGHADKHLHLGLVVPLQTSENGEALQSPTAPLWYLPSHTLVEVGLFCPLFFDCGAEQDYLHRLRAKGLEVASLTDAIVVNKAPKLNTEKQIQVTSLAEYCNPLLTHSWQRWLHGPVRLWAKGFSSLLRGKQATPYWQYAHELWQIQGTIRLWLNRPPFNLEGLRSIDQIKQKAPVLLLTYNRPEHTARLLNCFWQQPEAEETQLYILCDGAKGAEDREKVEAVQALAQQEATQKGVTVWIQTKNVGLANNVVEGVQRVLEKHDKVIVVEDDLILSPYFLRWINHHLELYQHHTKVAHLHAGTFYTHPKLSASHTLSFAGSWGWATWRDRWEELWEPDGALLLQKLQSKPNLLQHFNYNGFMPFEQMLQAQVEGRNSSWAVRWHASVVLHQRLSINANPPLVVNAGFDGTGRHASNDDRYHTLLPSTLFMPS